MIVYKNYSHERGNVLFLILIAVALFGALSMAISYSSSSGGTGGDIMRQQSRVNASEIIDYAGNLSTTISRLRLNGCTQDQISFENNIITTGYDNTLAPTDETCHVFKAAGGGAVVKNNTIEFTGSYVITNIGTADTDLIFQMPLGKAQCEEVNEILGIPNDGLEGPPSDSLLSGATFEGDYTIATTASANQRIEATNLIGRKEACRTNSGSGSSAVFMYYKVLLAR